MKLKATLRLENGMEFHGWSFGSAEAVKGELVFNTSMVGYPEQLTDATYAGQILCLTYPLIGNYGVPSEELLAEDLSKNLEGSKIHPKGLVIFDYCEDYSNWEAKKSLEHWMKEQGLSRIYGIDTRELTKILRDKGSMKGSIIPEGQSEVSELTIKASAKDVCCKKPIIYKAQKPQNVENANGSKAATTDGKRIVLIDLGVRHSIIRGLLERGAEVHRVPADYDFTSEEYDGVYVSNGPGCACNDDNTKTIEILRKVLESGKPLFGLGLGYLLIAKAAGAETTKLKRPHRSANQPVRKAGSNRSYITAQNASCTVKPNTIPSDWEPYFINLNDGAIDGIRHKSKPYAGAQFNPEVCVGLNENVTLIDEFINRL